jgi:lysophospholipase L1-like esterase
VNFLRWFIRNRFFAGVVVGLVLLGCTSVELASGKNEQKWVWIGTWAAAAQKGVPAHPQTFHNQTLRLIVHVSAAGSKIRITLSNIFGDQPLVVSAAHVARRVTGPDIDLATDRTLTFHGHEATRINARSTITSDPVDLEVPKLSDLAISLFLPGDAVASTSHSLALQTNYVSSENGNYTATAKFPAATKFKHWPFLTGVDVLVPPGGGSIVAFGSSLTDGDGSKDDANRRWPDVLAERLQNTGDAKVVLGVLNAGIIGNRLLSDNESPNQSGGPPPLGSVFQELGPVLGEAGLKRFERDVLAQAGVKYVIVGLGVNDILFPGSFIPAAQTVTSDSIIAGYRELITRAHKRAVRVIGSTIPPFEHAIFRSPDFDHFYTPEKEQVRQQVNAWIRGSGAFDGAIDFDAAVRDPKRPTQLLPQYDSGDHLHPNDAGNIAQGNAISLTLFQSLRASAH